MSKMIYGYDFEVDGIFYNKLSDDKVEVTKDRIEGNSYVGIVNIPKTIFFDNREYNVTSIGNSAFYYCDGLTSITIPNSVTSIGGTAFSGCSALASITIPNSVNSIGTNAFADCRGLTSITIPNSVTSIGKYAFSRCNGLTSITISNSLTSIEKSAFYYCTRLTSITIPNSVTSIGDTAFSNCSSLTSITIPNSVTSIGDAAFLGCRRLTSIKVESGNIKYDSRNSCNAIIETSSNTLIVGCMNTTIPNSVTSIGNYAFDGCSGLTSITIPNSVTRIGSSAFKGCGGLTSITIPNTVTSIGEHAFDGCSGLASITIPNSVTSIEKSAFENCSGLTSITIPSSVTSIGNRAFYCCTRLTSITIPNSVTSIEEFAFMGCDNLTSVTVEKTTPISISFNVFSNYGNATLYVPMGSKSAYAAADYWKYFKSIVEIGQNISLSISSNGNGTVTYNGTTIRNGSHFFDVEKGTSATITFTPDNEYRIASLYVNGNDVTSSISNNKYTVSNISKNTTVEVTFEAIPATTYTLSIKSVGNGFANYNGTDIRGETSAFAVNEGASATITLYPDEGYSIKSAIVDDSDVLSDIRNNKITLQNISHDILVNIHFENKCDSIIKEFYATQELVDNELANCRQQLDDLKKLIEKAKEIDADGFGSYEAKYEGNKIALSSIEENARIQKESIDALLSSYNEYGIEDSGDEYINGYAERFDYGLKKAKELLMLIHEMEDDINTTYSQLNDELNNLPQIVTYTMSITSSGNGYASYDGVQVRNTTTSFTVNEGTTATITFVPDNGYQIASVKLNNSDVTTGVSNNSYTINNIKANTTLEVAFEAMPTTVIADGVNYNITSQTEQTVSVANGSYGQVLTVPATVTGHGKSWTVTGIEANALSGNTQLAAIIWNPEVAFTATVSNPNLLLYVKVERYAPSAIQNVVVNGTANSIVLTEAQSDNDFYCPQAFTARRISFTHNYKMTTGIGESRGWETIALPFDVQTITHATKGEIVSFANWTSGSTKKPFWLYQLTGSGFKEADAIKAYTPYILSMPNNSQYGSEWLLNGSVTFSATNVTIRTSDNVQTATYSGRTFVPNYADRVANEGLYALNVVNDFVFNNSGMTEGSKFVLNMRKVHPFEAYMTSSSNARTYFDIFDDLSTDIKEEFIVHSSQFMAGGRVFDLQGRKVEHPSKKGVYIVNGKKKVIK